MFPAVPLPDDVPVRRPLEVQLAPGWRYDSKRRVFRCESGATFSPDKQLPKHTKIVYQVPALAKRDPAKLSEPERVLARCMHIMLPPDQSPGKYLSSVAKWPCVSEVHESPEISLP